MKNNQYISSFDILNSESDFEIYDSSECEASDNNYDDYDSSCSASESLNEQLQEIMNVKNLSAATNDDAEVNEK